MITPKLSFTYIGGPTCLIDFGGVKLLTDPTFDPPGDNYSTGPVTLHKLAGPAIFADRLGPIDYVLLSHDHHFDNLDHSGRKLLPTASKVFTTEAGAQRLGGNSVGLAPWQTIDLPASGSRTLRVVATPARHGPDGKDRGPVIGFVLFFIDAPDNAIYFAGDTVWFDGVSEVSRRFNVKATILNLGAARVPVVGDFHLTMTAEEAVLVARVFANAVILPLHFEDWAHFSEGRGVVAEEFAKAGIQSRLRWLERGRPTTKELAI